MKTLENANYKNKHVLLYADYNVTFENEAIKSSFKIDRTVKSINYIIGENPLSLTITTHRGRPRNIKEKSTTPIYEYLKKNIPSFENLEMIKIGETHHLSEFTGFFFTDNIRYYNDQEIKKFISLFDVIINDAFGCVHRSMPFKSYAGFLMEEELNAMKSAKECDLLILGGNKVSDKLKIPEVFNSQIFIGGCLAISVYKFIGYEVGSNSAYEHFDCSTILEKINSGQINIPVDFKVKNLIGVYNIKDAFLIESDDEIIDVGPKSMDVLRQMIEKSKMICWNGPLGKFEDPNAISTYKLIELIDNSKKKVFTGGGETSCALINNVHKNDSIYISTGGGAMISFLAEYRIPGIESILE